MSEKEKMQKEKLEQVSGGYGGDEKRCPWCTGWLYLRSDGSYICGNCGYDSGKHNPDSPPPPRGIKIKYLPGGVREVKPGE